MGTHIVDPIIPQDSLICIRWEKN